MLASAAGQEGTGLPPHKSSSQTLETCFSSFDKSSSRESLLTFPKYRSSTSTYRWMTSSVTSSLSPDPIPQTKNSEAYRRYTTLVSKYTGQSLRFEECERGSQANLYIQESCTFASVERVPAALHLWRFWFWSLVPSSWTISQVGPCLYVFMLSVILTGRMIGPHPA